MNRSPFFLLAQTPHDAASFLLAQKGSGKFVLTLNTELLARSHQPRRNDRRLPRYVRRHRARLPNSRHPRQPNYRRLPTRHLEARKRRRQGSARRVRMRYEVEKLQRR